MKVNSEIRIRPFKKISIFFGDKNANKLDLFASQR